MRSKNGERGVTTTQLMAGLAIVAATTGLAVSQPSAHDEAARSLARRIAAVVQQGRLRALAVRERHELIVTAHRVTLVAGADAAPVATLDAPGGVGVVGFAAREVESPAEAPPPLEAETRLTLGYDGIIGEAGSGATLFVAEDGDRSRFRVVVAGVAGRVEVAEGFGP